MESLKQKISRVLVVDDDERLNILLCNFLNSKGFETLSATSLSGAREILQVDSTLDVIVLDYYLGDGVGMDLLVPSAAAAYIHLPSIIMISTNGEAEFLEQCFNEGVDDYLIKPINLPLLALKVEALIKSVNMQRLIHAQKEALENFKAEAKREEQIAKFTYEYFLRQNSYNYQGVEVWLKSFSAFSGDMALVKKSPSGNLYFILADATGHGLSAAITILPVVTIFNSMVSKGFHLQKIVSEINRKLVTDTPADRFVAAVVIEINPFKRALHIWNGGMPAVYWVNQGQLTHQFRSNHMALGILSENMFDSRVITIDLPEQGFIFAHSDGLTEQENKLREPFSRERVINVLAQQSPELLHELSQQLSAHAGTQEFSDDISACIIQPALVFNDLSDDAAQINHQLPSITNAFEWSVKLSGHQLERCEIPPLCNHFLDQVGVDQYLCQKIFTVLAELVSNALDHGVLGLSSSVKENPNGFIDYFFQREERLKTLTDNDFIKISIQWQPAKTEGRIVVEVENSGAGYASAETFDQLASHYDEQAPYYKEHGDKLLATLTESLEIIAPGNKIRASIK